MAPLIPLVLFALVAAACGAPAPPRSASSPEVTARPSEHTPVPTDTREGAPDFTLTTLDGGSFTLSEERGRPVVLNFWAPW